MIARLRELIRDAFMDVECSATEARRRLALSEPRVTFKYDGPDGKHLRKSPNPATMPQKGTATQ